MASFFDRSAPSSWSARSWDRREMPDFDARFARLTAAARRLFVEDIRAAARPNSAPPKTPAARLPEGPLLELVNAGLVERAAGARGADQITVPRPLYGFAARLRALARYRLLRESEPDALRNFAGHAFDIYWLRQYLTEIVEKAVGHKMMYMPGDPVHLFVPRASWPEWVAAWLKAPLAAPVLAAIEKAGGQMPITEVAGHLPGAKPEAVRETIDRLVTYLALVEDLDPVTYELQIGLLPEVRAARRRRAGGPAALPPAEVPAELVPEAGIEVPDLRAVLLEVASEPPRLRQDRGLFVKEMPRFTAALPPVSADLFEGSHSPEDRVDLMIERARLLKFAREQKQGSEKRLVLTERGRGWLASPSEAQYAAIYAYLRDPPRDLYLGEGDRMFLGSDVFATPAGKRDEPIYLGYTSRDRGPLREALYRAWSSLPVGTFYRTGALIEYLSQPPLNPVYLGTTLDKVRIWLRSSPVPALEDLAEEAGQLLLRQMLDARLVSLGALQMGWTAEGHPVVARLPRLDAYFGHAPAEGAPAPAEPAATRVVVQPDFSVMIIGPSPEPAAALAPFAARVHGHAGGAITYKLTRESVVRGMTLGLTAEEVLGRLEKYASTPVPANVRKQVESWADRVRTVTASAVELVRCPDAETAQRVIAALGKKAERLAETLVALPTGSLKGAVRQKLRDEGLLVAKGSKGEAED